MEKLTSKEFDVAIKNLNGWSPAKDRVAIEKAFKFSDFKQAFNFMTIVAAKAEEMNHHPEWFNVYSNVKVSLSTHDAKGVTRLDIEMAEFMDQIDCNKETT